MTYREVGLLPEDEREVIETPDGDPRKRGTVVAVAPIRSTEMALTPAPAEHPARASELVIARPSDLLVARDLGPLGAFDPRRLRP